MNTFNVSESYRNAPDYDWEYRDFTEDIAWWLDFCQRCSHGGEVLEMACGTGRVLIPLARAGLTVTGVDLTSEMLAQSDRKMAEEIQSVQRRVTLLEGDMRSVNAGYGGYDVVFVAFNSFLHLLTAEDQLSALRNIHAHLKPNGFFAADVFSPDLERLVQGMGPRCYWRKELFAERPETGETLIRKAVTRYDPATQIAKTLFNYEIYELAGERTLVRKYWSPFTIRVIYPGEWRLLLQMAGFKIVAEYGGYDNQPYGPASPKMLFVCKKV